MQRITTYPRWAAFIAGAASATGFAPLNLWPVTLVCFALFIHLVAQADSGKRAALIGWLFGVGHFTIGNNWIAVAFTFQAAMPAWLGWIAVVALALYLAVYPAVCAWGAWWIGRLVAKPLPLRGGVGVGAVSQPPRLDDSHHPSAASRLRPSPEGEGLKVPIILAFAGCWIVTEWLRSWVFTGYVWNPLAVVTTDGGWLSKPGAYVGTYGQSGLIILAIGFAMLFARHVLHELGKKPLTFKRVVFVIAFFVLPEIIVIVALPYLIGPSVPKTQNVTITIAQPNRPQNEKDLPGYEEINFAKLATNSYPLPGQGPRLILWSEDALPYYLEDGYPFRFYHFQPGGSAPGARNRLTTLMGEGDILLLGSNRLVIDQDGQMAAARNSMTAMDARGRVLGNYDKAHLVPYGEYLPLKWLLTPLGLSRLVPGDVDFLPGPGPQTMMLKVDGRPVKVGLQICYEIIFSGQVVDRTNRPDFLFNPSNDSWFGTVGPPQFLAQARLRAIEEGLPVLRATPTGISAVIDANGQIVASIGMGKTGRIDTQLPAAKAPTLFALYGNILPVGFALLLIAVALLPLARSRTSR